MTFLTRQELIEMTGAVKRPVQIRWLLERGYRFEVGADGNPKVLWSAVVVVGAMVHDHVPWEMLVPLPCSPHHRTALQFGRFRLDGAAPSPSLALTADHSTFGLPSVPTSKRYPRSMSHRI